MSNIHFEDTISIGVGILIFDRMNDTVLLGKRILEEGKDTWSTPGGYIEHGETIFECATRETFEETGITIKDILYLGVSHIIQNSKSHVSIGCCAIADDITIYTEKILDKEIEEWLWVPISSLKDYKIWEPCKAIFEMYESKKMLIEYDLRK